MYIVTQNVIQCLIGKHLTQYEKLGHPYVHSNGIGEEFPWVLCMNSLMSEVLSTSDCFEVDITYGSSIELETSSMLLVSIT